MKLKRFHQPKEGPVTDALPSSSSGLGGADNTTKDFIITTIPNSPTCSEEHSNPLTVKFGSSSLHNSLPDDDLSDLSESNFNVPFVSHTSKYREASTVIQPKTKRSLASPASFNEGNGNPSQLSFHTDKIYGRDKEVAQLKESFEKTASIDRQLVLLEGTAGAGKSALAYQLRQTVQQKAGFFIGGKFDQSTQVSSSPGGQGDEPYAAVTMACRELCDALLAHKEDPFREGNKWAFTFEEVQEKLHGELEKDVLQVLTTVFPDLMQILGGNYLTASNTTGGPELGYNEAKQQFKYAVRRLLRVMCSFGRMVLFLDDCQWADPASLGLLKNLITDCKLNPVAVQQKPTEHITSDADATAGAATAVKTEGEKDNTTSHSGSKEMGLLVLVAYRSEEVDDTHPFMKVLQEIEKATTKDHSLSYSVDLSTVAVTNLDLGQVNKMLFDILAAGTLQETLPLADCVHRKTEGNMLYVIQFLRALSSETQETPLLKYNQALSKWEWDVDEIRLHESATKNVVQMIQQKLKNLPDGIRKLLPVVALLGASFEYFVFDRVIRRFNQYFKLKPAPSSEELKEDGALLPDDFLRLCDKEGVLVFNHRLQQIRWDHDKIQEAALELADEHELSKLRIHLGRFLMGSFSKEDQDKNVFILVNLLNAGNISLPAADANRIFLAELNLKAGTKSLRAAAYTSATVYLDRGINLLPEDHWDKQYDLSLELFSTAAQAHSCSGQMAEANICCEEVHSQLGCPLLDKQRVNVVRLDVMNAQGQTQLAQVECIQMLSELGCKFPKFGQGFLTIGGLLKMEMSVKSLEKKILNLPVMTDPSKRWVMLLLDRLCTYAYQNKSDLFGIVIMKAFQCSLKYGRCDYTPTVLNTVGMMLSTLGDQDANNRFGELAIDQYNSSQISHTAYARTVFLSNAFNFPLHKPTWEYRKNTLEGYKVGMACGDVESALWMILTYLESGFHSGLPLVPLENDLHAYTQQMSDLKQEKVGIPCMALWQVVSNLLGHSDKWSELETVFGKRLETVFGECEQSEDIKGFVQRYRMTNAFWCGDYEKVFAIMEANGVNTGEWDRTFMCSFILLPALHFHCAIACFALFHQTKTKKYKKIGLHQAKIAKGLSKWGNPCLKHFILFVDAEKEACKKKSFGKAVTLYKETILLAGEHRILHDQALGNERLGELYLRHQLESDALLHFQEASKLYLEWGSVERSKAVFSLKGRQFLQATALSAGSPITPPIQPFFDGMFVVPYDH